MESLKYVLICALIFLLSGCIFDSEKKKKAKFEIVYTSEDMWRDCPSLQLVVKNIGNLTGYDVYVTVYAKDAFGNVLDTATNYADHGYSIRPGNTGDCEAIFYKLKSHDDYSKLEYKLTWVTVETE